MPAFAAGIALLTVACGGNPSPAASGGGSPSVSPSGPANAVAYSQCMRSHGISAFPDPVRGGGVPKTDAHHLGVSDSVLSAAQQACQHLLPTTGLSQHDEQQCLETESCSPAQVQAIETTERKFAECMRSHGMPDWPDPTIDDHGRPVFNLVPVGITDDSASIRATITECQHLDPTAMGLESN